MSDEVMTRVERARAEVEATMREHRECAHRAFDQKYNLLRESERRWSVVRVSRVSHTLEALTDVITFERVSKPLAFQDAIKACRDARAQ